MKNYTFEQKIELQSKAWMLGIPGGIPQWDEGVVESDTRSYGYFYDIPNRGTNPGLKELRAWTSEQFELLKLVGVVLLRKNTAIMGGLEARVYCFRAPETSKKVQYQHDALPRSIKGWHFKSEDFYARLEKLDVSNLLPLGGEYVEQEHD